jgi:hypothetical protein
MLHKLIVTVERHDNADVHSQCWSLVQLAAKLQRKKNKPLWLRYREALSPKEPETDDNNQTTRDNREDQIYAPAERLQHCGEDEAQAPGADEIKHQSEPV